MSRTTSSDYDTMGDIGYLSSQLHAPHLQNGLMRDCIGTEKRERRHCVMRCFIPIMPVWFSAFTLLSNFTVKDSNAACGLVVNIAVVEPMDQS
uniref:Uncharacterized protein n=1 Tax=Knipowitschia caucasica TaxID=637954 RepID=A0AAV2LTD3_KNICA